ncbi:MAG: YDG domain-containing protein, partial [Planctomycetaceae bacterium]
YDGTTNVVLSGTAKYAGLATVDAVKFATPTLSGARTAAFADKHVGTAKPVPVDGYVAPSTNYTLTPLVLKANITPKAITVTGATAVNRVYDGTKVVAIDGGVLTGTIAGDSVAPAPGTAIGTMVDKKAGLAKAVTVTGYSLSGADAGNYTFPQPAGLKVNIAQKALAVTGVAAVSRAYDGTTVGTVSGTPQAAPGVIVAGDAVTVGGTAKIAFADPNVGTAKAVTVTGYTLSGLDATNYVVQQPAGLTADITPRALTITGLTATSRIYDGTTNVAITGTAKYGNLAAVDAVKYATPTLAGARTAAFADKTAGSAKPVAVNGYVAPDGNYTLTPLVLAANITKKALSLTGVVAAGRTYDGTTAIKITGGALAVGAVVAGDDAVLDTSAVAGSVADKNAGLSKPVTVTGFAISGTDSGNYSLAQPTTLKATITARSIGVTGLAGVDREYDATTVAQASGTAALVAASLVAGDDVALVATGAKYAFATSAVGVAKAITASGFTLSGADAANYAVVQPVGLKATVTQATITVTGPTLVLTRDAGGTVVIPTLAATISGLKGTDAVTGAPVLTTTATATSPVGTYAVKVTLGTLKASTNYKFAFIDGSIEIQ